MDAAAEATATQGVVVVQAGEIDAKYSPVDIEGSVATCVKGTGDIGTESNDDGGADENTLGHRMRRLTVEEMNALAKDTQLVTEFWRKKYDVEANKFWDRFYRRNEANFFKDRHWTLREFDELVPQYKLHDGRKTLLEVGCGVGNLFFPLVEADPSLFVHACDFATNAVELIKKNPLYDESRIHAFVCDITTDALHSAVNANSVDFVSMIFVLSAIHPDAMPRAIANIFKVLRPGGVVVFRDYGLYDQAMLRFGKGQKLGDAFYVRQDGTRAYYFSEEVLGDLFISGGFAVLENSYVERETVNRKQNLSVKRIFVQSRFQKPHNTS